MSIQRILERLDEIEAAVHNSASKPFSLSEAAAYLNISRSYLYKLTASANIPHFKPQGKLIYFDKQDLDAWLRQNRVQPIPLGSVAKNSMKVSN
jgi:excisionase family DNA binding protein